MSGAFERYLEAIYEAGECAGGEVRVKDIAASLGVSKPSVSEMVDRMVENQLVTHDKYQHIKLTAKGRRIAKGLDRKHETIKHFFIDMLGVDPEMIVPSAQVALIRQKRQQAAAAQQAAQAAQQHAAAANSLAQAGNAMQDPTQQFSGYA